MAQQIINIGTANNSGDGEGLRSGGDKINDNFIELYGIGGFGYYVDSLETPTITVGTSWTQITIDALGPNVTDYLPFDIRGFGQLWTTNKITPIAIGDDYDGRIDLTISAKTGAPTSLEFIIEISSGSADTTRAFTGYIEASKTPPYKKSLPIDFYSLATFISNGGRIFARTDTGSMTISDRAIKISRKSKNVG